MIIVTGGAGFIGSNIVRHLNRRDIREIVVVDDLSDGRKIFNLADCDVMDYWDKDEFLVELARGSRRFRSARTVFHEGACTVTTEWDGRMMLQSNFTWSKCLLEYCAKWSIPLIYASSASVYGAGSSFRVERDCEHPINAYAFSKLLFDQYLRANRSRIASQVTGLRYFNVYGPGEAHKGEMASVIFHFNRQLLETGELRLFEGSDGYDDGEQRRDFIHVDDVAAVNLWLMDRPGCSGIYNLGTGHAHSFNEVANAVIRWHGRGKIHYIPFPEKLRDSYQSFTEADMSGLRAAGYDEAFLDIDAGVSRYLDDLNGDR